MQVRHRLPVFCGAFASSIGRCLLTGRNHINIPRVSAQRLLSWHTPEELVFVLLRHSKCLISQNSKQLLDLFTLDGGIFALLRRDIRARLHQDTVCIAAVQIR